MTRHSAPNGAPTGAPAARSGAASPPTVPAPRSQPTGSAEAQRLEAFARQVSHDLKNPLATVAMALEMAGDRATDPVQADLLDRARRGVERATSMVEQMLERATTGVSVVMAVDLAQTLADVREDLIGVLPPDRVVAGELPVVQGDPVAVRVVLQNLLANAAKFTHPDRPVQVQVQAVRDGGAWRVEVRDNGRGVGEADRQRIFDAHVRVDTDVAGHGIGLATCRDIVESLGGEIGVESSPGVGSTFWFTIPA